MLLTMLPWRLPPDDDVASSSAYEEEEEGVENEYDDELSLRHRVSSFPILVS
jgi:hypothetical protein